LKEGRPLEMKGKERGQPHTFYIDPLEKEKLEEIRWRERKSMSQIIRLAIDEYIQSHAEGNSTFRLDKWNEDPDFKAVPTINSKSETWFKYLQDCSKEERLDIQIKTNHINQQCKAIKE